MKVSRKDVIKVKGVINKTVLVVRMLMDKFTGKYKGLSNVSMLLLLGLLVYMVVPVDFLPEGIPLLGISDDVLLAYLVYGILDSEIQKYQEFRIAIARYKREL